MNLNPYATIVMWALSMLMVSALVLGPTYVFAVTSVSVAYALLLVFK